MNGMLATGNGKVEIKCSPVIIPGFEEFKFIVHHSIGFDGWTVSEKTTGLAVTGHHYPRTRKAAIETAENVLRGITASQLEEFTARCNSKQ